MQPYRIELKISADKTLQSLPTTIQKRIVRAIEQLADDPRPSGVVKISGDDNAWRIRVGDYRIIYEIHDGRLLVLVIRIWHRCDIIYRKKK